MFAGIGGFRSGMEQAGHKCVGFIEWDKYARQSYQAMYDTEGEYNAKDIQIVSGTDLPDADVWCFGSPCQSVSLAGKRAGLKEGTRSGLFLEVIRLLKERIKNKKALPKYLFMENVKGLLSSTSGRDFARVQIEMDEAGYDVEWNVFNSAEVVPQNRERIYIVGHLRGQSTRQVFPIKRESGETNKTIEEVARIYPNRHSSDANSIIDQSGITHTVTAHSYKDSPKIAVKQLGNISDSKSFGGNPQVGRVYATDGLAPTLNTMQGGGREPKILDDNGHKDYKFKPLDIVPTLRKLTPLECWRLQGFTDEQFYKARKAGLSDSQLYKQSGNAVTVPVIYQIARRLQIDE